MYRAYLCPNCSGGQAGNSTLLAQAHGALATFVNLHLIPPQWWWLQIGIPGIGDIDSHPFGLPHPSPATLPHRSHLHLHATGGCGGWSARQRARGLS